MIALILVIAAIVITATFFWPSNGLSDEFETSAGFEYRTVEVEGMPCIVWKDGSAGTSNTRGGLTCNWNRWKR
jgi:hypothetical protein